jgi:hypothetical protein
MTVSRLVAKALWVAICYCYLVFAIFMLGALVEALLGGSYINATTWFITGDRDRGFTAWLLTSAYNLVPPVIGFGVLVFLLTIADLAYQKWGGGRGGSIDLRYYPRLTFVRQSMSSVFSLIVVGAGIAFVVYMWVSSAVEMARAYYSPHGMIEITERVSASVFLLWAALWFVDALRRPQRRTLITAYGCLFLAAAYALVCGIAISVL